MESQLNALLTDTNIWMVCPYDSRIARPDVLADALRTHPERLDGVRLHRPPGADRHPRPGAVAEADRVGYVSRSTAWGPCARARPGID